ncbi:MAG: iron ABC transporter permease, partial [Treponema sp.]|nr:iron ABC transporter permease [Treponema sp.]
MTEKKRLAVALVASIFVIAAGSSLGSANISLWDTALVILRNAFRLPVGEGVDPVNASIIWLLRLPRVLLAFCAGGCLALSGAVCQSILRNPLATPYILGVSAGASLGAGIVIVSGFSLFVLGPFTLPATGFVFGVITVFLVAAFATRVDASMSSNTIILCGMVASLFLHALLTTLSAIFSDDLRRIVLWQMGSFALRGWPYVQLLLPFMIVGAFGVMFYAKEM